MDKAFDVLVENYRNMLMIYLQTLTGNYHTAEDLTQETFLAAYDSFDKFKKGESFGAWLRGIARNKVLMNKRSSRRRPLIIDDRVVQGMEDVYGALDQAAQVSGTWDNALEVVHECVGKLNGLLQKAVNEVYHKGKTLQTAADALDVSFDTVAKRLSRSRVLIRECVQRRI